MWKRGWVKRGGGKGEGLRVVGKGGKVKCRKGGRLRVGKGEGLRVVGKRGREGVSMFKGGKRAVCELRKDVWV